jgi:hypothetical protein
MIILFSHRAVNKSKTKTILGPETPQKQAADGTSFLTIESIGGARLNARVR